MITRIFKNETLIWKQGSWVNANGDPKLLPSPPTLPNFVYKDGEIHSVEHLGIGDDGYTLILSNEEVVTQNDLLVCWISKHSPLPAQIEEFRQKLGADPVILIFGGNGQNQKFKGEILRRIVEFYQAPITMAVVSDKDVAFLKDFYKGVLLQADMGFDGSGTSHLEFLEVESYKLKRWLASNG